MRTYLKSLGSFSWAMSLFGLKNLGALLTFSGFRRRGTHPDSTSAGLDAATRTLTENLGAILKAIFHSGDRLFRGLVDLSFGRPQRRSSGPAMPWLNAPSPGQDPAAPPASPADSPFGPMAPPAAAAPAPPSSAFTPPAPPAESGWGPMPPIPDTPSAEPGAAQA